MMTEILTPESPRWSSFVNTLDIALQEEGCDARSLRLATRIMADMGDVDIAGSIEFFEKNGGYCDCEILMNVDPW